MGGEFDESQHPRASDGKFTEGSAGEHASTAAARTATTRAVDGLKAATDKKPALDAKASEHEEHANRLREAAKGLGKASQAHIDAGRAASERGDPTTAREHFEASRQLSTEAKSRLNEASEHRALAHVNADHEKAAEHSEAAHAVKADLDKHDKEREHEDAKASPKAQGDHSAKGHGSKGGAAHGGGHGAGGHGAHGAHGAHHGIAHWVSEKLGELPEKVHEAGEGVREVEEGAMEAGEQ